MKFQKENVLMSLLWLLVLAAYVAALAQMEQGLNWFFTIVTPLAALGAAQEWAKLFQPKKKPA